MVQSGGKIRLDQLLGRLRPELSRSRIRAEIMAGRVLIGNQVCDKPGHPVSQDASVTLREKENPYVSRGGLKLAAALDELDLEVRGLVTLDVGASTGGFTDCLLQRGAALVYALDVGRGQLASSLRYDNRVMVMEGCNARYLDTVPFPTPPQLAVVDISFISLLSVMPALAALSVPVVLALVKPQFEVGRVEATKGRGVIRDPRLHQTVLDKIAHEAPAYGYFCGDLVFSRFPGPRGNLEFFMLLKISPLPQAEEQTTGLSEDIVAVVNEAHAYIRAKT